MNHSSTPFERIDHVALRVSDLAASVAWYEETLGFERVETPWGDFPVILKAGGVELALFAAPPGVTWPPRGDRVVRHVALRVGRPGFDAWARRLREQSREFRFEDHGACHSLYLLDPDETEIEIVTWDVRDPTP